MLQNIEKVAFRLLMLTWLLGASCLFLSALNAYRVRVDISNYEYALAVWRNCEADTTLANKDSCYQTFKATGLDIEDDRKNHAKDESLWLSMGMMLMSISAFVFYGGRWALTGRIKPIITNIWSDKI